MIFLTMLCLHGACCSQHLHAAARAWRAAGGSQHHEHQHEHRLPAGHARAAPATRNTP